MIERAYLSLRESQAQKTTDPKNKSAATEQRKCCNVHMCTLQHYRVATESIINTTVRIIINIKVIT